MLGKKSPTKRTANSANKLRTEAGLASRHEYILFLEDISVIYSADLNLLFFYYLQFNKADISNIRIFKIRLNLLKRVSEDIILQ